MLFPRKVYSGVNSDGELGQVYDIPTKYGGKFRLFTSGGVHQYSNSDAELKEQMTNHGHSTDDSNLFEPPDAIDTLSRKVEEGLESVNSLIAATQDDEK